MEKYNISGLTDKTINGFRSDLASNSPQSTLLSSGRVLTLAETSIGLDVATVIKGYFKPPKTGRLKFYVKADSKLTMFLSTTYGTTSTLDYGSPFLQIVDGSPITVSPTLTVNSTDHLFYFEIYHISNSTSGFFSISAEVSNSIMSKKVFMDGHITDSSSDSF